MATEGSTSDPHTKRRFIGYHAAVALLAAARELPTGELPRVDEALVPAEGAVRRLRPDADRSTTLRFVREELNRRTAGSGRSNLTDVLSRVKRS